MQLGRSSPSAWMRRRIFFLLAAKSSCRFRACPIRPLHDWYLAVNGGRINIGACSLGGAAFCLDAAQNHTAVRKQFGQAIGNFQAIQFKLAEMATSLHSARLMVR